MHLADHEYPLLVWAAGEVVREAWQICAAILKVVRYALCMGTYGRLTHMCGGADAVSQLVSGHRALILQTLHAPQPCAVH